MDAALRIAVVLVLVAGLSIWRLRQDYERVPTTLEGAQDAIAAIAEWAKWMSGIQTATLGGVSWFLAETCNGKLNSLTEPRRTFAVAGFVFTGIGLFCCAWVLSATPSVLTRVHGYDPSRPRETFDVQEMSMFAAKSPSLGNMMALQHWLWAIGLACFGLVILWP
jgi:hypothetical protein